MAAVRQIHSTFKTTTQESIDWPASNRNAGRNEIGISGRLQRNTYLSAVSVTVEPALWLRPEGQYTGRDHQRPLQRRGYPSVRTMAELLSRRVRDAGVGGLVQQSTAAGVRWRHPASRNRGTLLRHAQRAEAGSVTHMKRPPRGLARFILHSTTFRQEASFPWAGPVAGRCVAFRQDNQQCPLT